MRIIGVRGARMHPMVPTVGLSGWIANPGPTDFGRSCCEAMDNERRARVLIVDDEPETATTCARMLRLEGYEVQTAVDSVTALRVVSTESFDAVLLDLW